MGQSSTYLVILISFIVLHSLHTPPTLGGGTYAIIGKRWHWQLILYLQSSHLYLTSILLIAVGRYDDSATIDRDPNYRDKHS